MFLKADLHQNQIATDEDITKWENMEIKPAVIEMRNFVLAKMKELADNK